MNKLFTLILIVFCTQAFAQKLDTLTVEKIMRDPKWIGISPTEINWSDDSKKIYYELDLHNGAPATLFSVGVTENKPEKVTLAEHKALIPNGEWNKARTLKVYEKNGDIFLEKLKTGRIRQLISTVDEESGPVFSGDESKIVFRRGDNLYEFGINEPGLIQLTNFVRTASAKTGKSEGRKGGNSKEETAMNDQDRWLKGEQLELFEVIKEKEKNRKLDSAEQKELAPKRLKEIFINDKSISDLKMSPDRRYISYRLTKSAEGAKRAIVPDYVTSSGFTEDIPNRTKVGAPQAGHESFIFDTGRDSVYKIITKDIPGIKDLPDYVKDYPKQLAERTKLNEDRKVTIERIFWNEDGKYAVADVTADDNKDRWIMKLDPLTGNLTLLDREHNDAWVGGPGIDNLGWVDNSHFYFESEASGYAHIYMLDVATGEKRQITNGKWEVQTLQLSNDKKTFYFTANIDHPGITHFYSIPVTGGGPVKITSMKGMNDVSLSPDEKWLAIRYSYTNKPWELYIQPNTPGAASMQITNSASDEFKSYPWRDPEIITFKNRYGCDVYAHLYLPKKQGPAKPAVVFVHGAGYLQNVDYGWSYYFREFMFNNMLADNGYTVLDMDYSGSAGYGRDWRTAIYRHMGGKDLSDQVDGVKMLVEKYDVNPEHVGLYGGSYGGFITLMAMFTEPSVFAAGGAIRSVTDWAHYNHGYTAAILNEPYNDEKAYRQSSPIYFANGLKGNLLMLHGMVDQNVNYQNIIRLTQRLIELHKDNWELASYPVEDHGFVQPSSWTDEYKRIFKLFETSLRNK